MDRSRRFVNVNEKTIQEATKEELAGLLIEALGLLAVLTFILDNQDKKDDERRPIH